MRKHVLFATVAAFALVPAAMAQTQQTDQTQQQTQVQTDTGAAATSVETAQDFVSRAAMSDLFEIEAARLASEQAESDEVKQYAERLMQEHRQSAADLAQAAQEANVDVAILDTLERQSGAGTPGTTGTTGQQTGATETTGATGTTGGTATTTDSTAGTTGTTGSTAQQPATTGAAGGPAAASLDQEHQGKLDELRAASGAEFDRMFVEMQIEAHENAIAMFEHFSENGDEEALQQHAEQALPTLRTHLEEAERLMETVGG